MEKIIPGEKKTTHKYKVAMIGGEYHNKQLLVHSLRLEYCFITADMGNSRCLNYFSTTFLLSTIFQVFLFHFTYFSRSRIAEIIWHFAYQ